MRVFLLSLLCCLIAALKSTQAVASEPPRPNILYLYVDDMGWGSIGPNGQFARKAAGKAHLITPTLDRLASEGVNFRYAYGCTVCSPARSSQQSGFHQGHTFADRNDPDNAKKAMRSDDLLMGDVLSGAGYATGYWGKWGYGGSKNQQNPQIVNVQTLPTEHGYQHVVAELHHVRAHTFFQPTLWHDSKTPRAPYSMELLPNSMARYLGNRSYPNAPAFQNHPDYPSTAYCDDVYAFAALDFVRTQAMEYNRTGQPFFGLLAVQVPHAPFDEVSKMPQWDLAYRDMPFFDSLSSQSQQWAAMITRIDGHFGNLLSALEDPNGDGDQSDSVLDNTLIVFQSDNGGPAQSSNNQFDANGGLRGAKGGIEEGGIRVPTLMRWPGKIAVNTLFKAGTTSNRMLDVTDLLPTFCDLAGAETPLGIDGVSVAPSLLGVGLQRKRDFLIHEAGNGQSILFGQHKLVRSKSKLRLYNLHQDPAEQNNLAATEPELVKKLETLLLGERVAEPAGFANTYHQWRGANGAATSQAVNWSDYEYANEGIVYMFDDGPPQLSWVARMENTGDVDLVATGDADLHVLGLEIAGADAKQQLSLAPNVNLNGRNEVRISKNGRLILQGGTVSSLRWVDVKAGGKLAGFGSIDAKLYNQGVVSLTAPTTITAGYHQDDEGSLHATLHQPHAALLQISGNASLGGTLMVTCAENLDVKPGTVFTLISASAIDGTFANLDDQVTSNGAARFRIDYTTDTVTLTAF